MSKDQQTELLALAKSEGISGVTAHGFDGIDLGGYVTMDYIKALGLIKGGSYRG